MLEVKVNYAKIANMGDLLNELIIEKVLGYKVIHSNRWECQTTGIGSSLNMFFPTKSELPSFPKNILFNYYGYLKGPLQIWSTGFITYSNEKHYFARKKINVAAVRGELTKKRLEKILEKKLDVPTGDGGLLASELIKPIEKKYSIGIIPHFREKEENRFQELTASYEKSILIDLSEEPLSVVEKIAQCEYILSSSLHGLIVADSFGIPNKRLVYSDALLGDGFKFDDYYSAFNIFNHSYFDLKKSEFPTLNDIIDDYKITKSAVDKKKDELFKSFSKYL